MLKRAGVLFGVMAVTVGVTLGSFVAPAAASGSSGPSVVSPRSDSVTSVPGTPFIENVTPEGLGVMASWTPNPITDAVTSYTLTAAVAAGYTGTSTAKCSNPPSTSVPSSDSSAYVADLCSGIPYVLTVTAGNAIGTSSPSDASNPVVPLVAQPPSSPLIGSVTDRNQSLVVSWSAPDLDGGDPLVSYTLSATAGTQTVSLKPTASATEAAVRGLTNGTQYQVSLVARSKAGDSAPAQSVGTPSAPYVPGQPLSLQVAPDGTGGLLATWSAPVDNGGDTVKRYEVTYQQELPQTGGGWVTTGPATTLTAAGTATSQTISKVGAKKFYGVSVAAVSAAGTGQPATTTQPVAPTTGLTSHAVMLTGATMDALSSDVDGTLTWLAPAPAQVQALVAGKVLVGPAAPAASQGLIAKVISVDQDASDDYIVQTTTASLTDAFTNLSAAMAGEPSDLEAAQIHPEVAGVRVLHSPSPAINISPTLVLGLSLQNGGESISGQFSINPDLAINVEINHGFLDIPDGINIAASASVTVKFQASAVLTGTAYTWTIDNITLPSFAIGPLEVTPKIPIQLNAQGKISLGITASVTVGAGMSWSSSNAGSLNTENLSKAPALAAAPITGVAASTTALLQIQIPAELDLYDVGGPDVDAIAALNATVNYNPSPGTPWFEIDPSVKLQAGLAIDLSFGPFSYNGELNVTLGTVTWPVYEIGAPPNADLVVSPSDPSVTVGNQLTFSTTRSDGETYPVVWSLVGAENGDSISQQGVLSVAAPGGRSLIVEAVDSTGAAGETTVEVGGEFDPPSDLTANASTSGTSATVSWQAPENTGGFPIASYVLTTMPPTSMITLGAAASSAQLSGLALNTTYVVSLYAINTENLTSPSASTYVAPPPPPTLTMTPLEAPLPADASTTDGFPSSELEGVTCRAEGACVAVGTYAAEVPKVGYIPFLGLIETSSDGSWRPMKAPMPAGADQYEGDPLYSVACSPDTCVAVGYFDNSIGQEGLIEMRSNGTWTPTEAPLPAGATGGDLTSVSCSSAVSCVAVGLYSGSSGGPEALIETLSGTTWTASTAALPANATSSQAVLDSVSCASAGFCVAVGSYSTSDNEPLVETLTGTTWTPTTVTLPGDAVTPEVARLSGVNCPTAGSCVALGYYEDSSTTYAWLVESLSGGIWFPTSSTLPLTSDLPTDSCQSVSSCVAVAGYSTGADNEPTNLIATHSAGTWTPSGAPLPSNAATGPDAENFFDDISCQSTTSCVAVGLYDSSDGGGQGFFETVGISG